MRQDEDRLVRARCSLEGLSVGDALGGFFEFAGSHAVKRIAARALPQPPWHYTDDTMMALSIVSVLRQRGAIDQDRLARSFAERYERARVWPGHTGRARADTMGRALARVRAERVRRPGLLWQWRGHACRADRRLLRRRPGGYRRTRAPFG